MPDMNIKVTAFTESKKFYYILILTKHAFFFFQAAGKYKQKGREYIVDDGDILYIKFNAGAGLTAKKK